MKLFAYCALWSSLLLCVAWFFSDPQRNQVDGYGTAWLDPAEDIHRPPIDPYAWKFSYEKIEKALLQLKCLGQRPYEISEMTETALRQAVEQFPAQPDERVLNRIRLLAGKDCAPINGHDVAELLIQYFHYHQAWLALQERQIQQGDDLTAEQKYQETEALREAYFGETKAHKLFGRQQAFAKYLFERQRIMADSTLTESDRSVQLEGLKQRFRKDSSESVDPG